MLKSIRRIVVIGTCVMIMAYIWSRGAAKMHSECADTCAALYATYVRGTMYGCVCEERDLSEQEMERASRRFMTPMGGVDIE
jgi:hypothetical protein